MEKLTKKQKRALEEQKLKAKMSDKAYTQYLLNKRSIYQQTIAFSQKFMLIAFGIFSAIMLVSLFFDRTPFWIGVSVVVFVVFVASVIWWVVDAVKFKPARLTEIQALKDKLQEYSKQEREQLEKMTEFLNNQKKAQQNNDKN